MKLTKNSIKKKLSNPTLQLVLAVLLWIVAVWLSRGAPMLDWEVSLFRAIYNQPEQLRPVYFAITQLGSVYTLMVLVALWGLLRRYNIMLRLLLTSTLAYLLSGVAKDLFGRMRPNEFLNDITILDYTVRGPGFPSGHTAMATALGLTLLHYSPKKYRPLLIALIALIAYSRVYLGLHAPLDIVGGFAIGWASYALFRHVRLRDVVTRKK